MKRTITTLAALILTTLTLSGCASTRGYFADRGRDAADIFTCTGGKGFGAGVRAGPVHCGLLYQTDYIGLAGGNVFAKARRPTGAWAEPLLFIPGPEGIFGGEADFTPSPDPRNKKYTATSDGLPPFSWFMMLPNRARWGHVLLADGSSSGEPYPRHYLTDINVAVACGVGLRLGFNPGELLDFLLGWATVDIFADDIGIEENKD